jgi:hypothetical protein
MFVIIVMLVRKYEGKSGNGVKSSGGMYHPSKTVVNLYRCLLLLLRSIIIIVRHKHVYYYYYYACPIIRREYSFNKKIIFMSLFRAVNFITVDGARIPQ